MCLRVVVWVCVRERENVCVCVSVCVRVCVCVCVYESVCVCDDHKSVILCQEYSELLSLFEHKLLYFFLKKSIPRVFIFNVIFLLQKVNCVVFAPGQQVTGLAA